MNDTIGTYDYCICFIEHPSNQALAERLLLEVASFRIPKNMRPFEGAFSYKKACLLALPTDGLLTLEQEQILNSSRWLIIFCTPLAREAKSIRGAIHYFILNKGRASILPVLLEGEPQSAFPHAFFEERMNTVTFNDGTTQVIKEIIEPLAIDVRAKDFKNALPLLHHARIKIVAALIGVSFDTLEQRHEKRLRRRLQLLTALVLAVPIILGSLFTYLWFNSEQQINLALQKTQISKDLLADMCKNYPVLFEDIPEARPLVDALLLESLERLRIADSNYISLLPIDDLLYPDEGDSIEHTRNKAKILRYLERKEAAVTAYRLVSLQMNQDADEFREAAGLFVEKAPVSNYPCGIWVRSITDEVSRDCDDLQRGDIIVAAKGFQFRSFEQFQLHVYSYIAIDKMAEMTILRPDGGTLTELTLKMKPEDLEFEGDEL